MSKKFFVHSCIGIVLVFGSATAIAQSQLWTLESTITRFIQEAPERGVAEAELRRQQGGLRQATVWPNPSIEIAATNALGKDDGQGGTDVNQFTIRQMLPVNGRLRLLGKQAKAHVLQAEAGLNQQNLLLEHEAARLFHDLQFSDAQLKLTKQRLKSTSEFQHIGRRREQAGDLSRLERLRLDLIHESSKQIMAAAAGAFSEARADFKTLLNIDNIEPVVESLKQFPKLPMLDELKNGQVIHPRLVVARLEIKAAEHGLAISQVNRFADPEIWVSGERDALADRRQNSMSIGVSMSLPLWDRRQGAIESARAYKQKTQRNADGLQRKLLNHLQLNHLHLSHLIKQGERFRIHVLEPATEIFNLSSKGFAAGQVEILNLVDAVDTYYEARVQYLELLQEAWLEAANLRREAGLFVLNKKGNIE